MEQDLTDQTTSEVFVDPPLVLQRPAMVESILHGARVTVLAGPVGSGKSVLVGHVVREAERSGRSVLRFDQLRPGLKPAENMAVIGDAMATSGGAPILIAIDDADFLDGRALSVAIERLLHTNSEARLLIAMRPGTPLPLARLRAAGVVDLLDADHLFFSPIETRGWLERHVPRKCVNRIAMLADNWPVALNLLARWAGSAGEQVDIFSDAEIIDMSGLGAYVAEEIAPGLSDVQRRAVLLGSLFEQPSREILIQMAPAEDLDRALAELPGLLPGLVRRSGNAFTLHPVIRACFEREVARSDRADRPEIYRRAAECCADASDLVSAARFARLGSVPERIDDYVARHGSLRIWVAMGSPIVRDLVSVAGPEIIAASLRMRMLQCVVLMKEGRVHEAEQALASVFEKIEDNPDLRDDAEILRTSQLVYGCGLGSRADLESFERIVAERSSDSVWQILLSTMSCILHTQRGRLDAARACLIEARGFSRAFGSSYNLLFLDMHLASIELACGNMQAARSAMTSARSRWRAEYAADTGVETVINALTAQIEFEAGQLTSARRSLRRSAYRLPDSEAWFDIYASAYEPMVRLLVIDHGVAAAVASIEESSRKLRVQGLDRVAALLDGYADCLSGEAWLHGIRPERADERSQRNVTNFATWQEHEAYTLANAYNALVSDHAAMAVEILDTAVDFARSRRLLRSELRFHLLLHAAHELAGNAPQAAAALAAAIQLGAETGMRQAFHSIGGPSLMTALARLQTTGPTMDEAQKRFVSTLLSSAERRVQTDDALTERELDVLSALAQGGSDKLLARRLGISEHGVRYHLRNIFRKLEVHDRVTAVARAPRGVSGIASANLADQDGTRASLQAR